MRILASLIFISILSSCNDGQGEPSQIETVALLNTEHMTFHELSDHVREFVNSGSVHVEDESVYSVNDINEYAHAVAIGEKPNIKCGHRARLVMRILSAAGYETRLVNLLTARVDYLDGHTFLEVKNPETGNWEVNDPDLNIYYSSSGVRLSVFEIVTLDTAAFKPCRGDTCSWNLKNSHLDDGSFTVPNMIVDNFYAVALVHSGRTSMPETGDAPEMLINTSRFTDGPWDRLNGKTAAQYYAIDKGGSVHEL